MAADLPRGPRAGPLGAPAFGARPAPGSAPPERDVDDDPDAVDDDPYAVDDDPYAVDDDPYAVDDDVVGAVNRELERLLAAGLARCRDQDPVFAEDIAERIARFTVQGGRRIRSRLVWWALRACGGGGTGRAGAGLRMAAALELIQTCALVHDDLMDAAPLRRGAPSLHADVTHQYAGAAPGPAARQLGASAAVLAGDLALVWADDAVAGLLLDGRLPPHTAHRLHEVWRGMRTEMVAGQYLDVQGQATAALSPTRALRAARLKSAHYTVERPLHFGAVLAGADTDTTRALRLAGRRAGLAFQLRDDLDDLFADPRTTGKPTGGDVRQGKPTYLLAVAHALAGRAGDRAALDLLEHAVGRTDLTGAELDGLRARLVAVGARDLVQAKIARLARQSLRHLDAADLEPYAATQLRRLLAETTGTPPEAPAPPGQQPAPPPAGPDKAPPTGPEQEGAR
ncbi:polyprenyl synthetase family protein [Streptomyces buecherae]|uniref:Polyprenyl synthetase family protein n=2 Tax=Streptomyces buecherae TaxID=2763006 RepID=A0A7H8NKL0_9ACTN|nr:polyprenyl synthetase family protein [Streptomyces buecherae]